MENQTLQKRRRIWALSFVVALVIVMGLLASVAYAQGEQAASKPAADPIVVRWAFIAAGLSTSFGCLGAAFAVAYVGSAAVAAVAEKPQIAGRALIFVGLAEGIAIYGLIIAIMILGRV